MKTAEFDANGTIHMVPDKKKFPIFVANFDKDGKIISTFARTNTNARTIARQATDGHVTILTKR